MLSHAALAAAPPPVGADHAMVVSAHRLASEAGASMLRQGGNVVDAAVATGYALAVVYPAAGNIGGGGFMTLRLAGKRPVFVDFREVAPHDATETMFQDADGKVVPGRSTQGWLAVGVPGSVAGLDWALSHYGTLPRSVVMAPAIALARDGFVLGGADTGLFALGASLLAKDPAAAAIFLRDGAALRPGDRLVQSDLASTLETIRDGGADAFYRGPVGHAIVVASRQQDGILSDADFDGYRVRELAPLRCEYRGYEILSAPPPSGGGVAICEALNILAPYDLRSLGFHSAASIHLIVEALRRVFHDRAALGDPDFVANPVDNLLDPDYAAGLRAGIDASKATPSADLPPGPLVREGQQTTHYSIADAAGNAVAVTTTLNGWFGNGRVAGGTGILMNNEMDDFSAKLGTPNMFQLNGAAANAVAPGKTPLSSMSPTLVFRDGKLAMVIGSPGGSRIVSIVLQAIINVVDYGMSASEAVDAPRFHHQGVPDVVELEPLAVSPDTRRLLETEGYALKERAPWGQAEAITAGSETQPTIGLDLPYQARPAKPFALSGANDDRGPLGAAIGF